MSLKLISHFYLYILIRSVSSLIRSVSSLKRSAGGME